MAMSTWPSGLDLALTLAPLGQIGGPHSHAQLVDDDVTERAARAAAIGIL